MSIWGALAGGFAGTLVLTTALRAGNELNLTRMDLPFLLGTAFSADRTRAKALGYVLHFLVGIVFALVYYAIFLAIGRSGWWLGGVRARARALLRHRARQHPAPADPPAHGNPVHRRDSVALLEPPGFLMRNYGASTPVVMVVAHLVYGAIVGEFVALSG